MAKAKEIIVPPLKWAGGKRWLLHQYGDLFPRKFNRFIEPFLGGAAAFFALRPKRAILSDVNPELINFYEIVRDEPSDLQSLMELYQRKHSKEFYYEMRSRRCRTRLTRAAKFLYLNRTCWNGLYRVNKKGQFNVPIGTKSTVVLDTDDFNAVSALLQNVELLTIDFEDAVNIAAEDDLLYVDPPYTTKHNFNGFVKYNQNIFSWEDQERLALAVKRAHRRGANIVLSNADHADVRALYADVFSLISITRANVIASKSQYRGKTSEMVATNV